MHRSLGLLALLLFVGCGDSSKDASKADDGRTIALSMGLHVAPGTESHKCQMIRVPDDRAGHIARLTHSYTAGSHHLVLFRTDVKEIAPGGDGIVDCFASGVDVMTHVRGVLYASQSEKGDLALPTGVGLKLTAGEVLLMQSHYLNPQHDALDAKVDLQLHIADEATITEEAGVLFFYDPFIFVPANSRASALMRCKIPNDIQLLTGVSHMHRRGNGYDAYVDGPSGELSTTPFYSSSDWDHPGALGSNLSIAAGSRLRFRCDYNNIDGTSDFLQGQSADVNEMCVFSGVYHPAMTQRDDLCQGGAADMFGMGTKACGDSLKCIQSCPPSRGGTTPFDIDPCWQKCFSATCPTAGAPLLAQLGCIREKCSTDCGGSDATACAGCVLRDCGPQYDACNTHKCE